MMQQLPIHIILANDDEEDCDFFETVLENIKIKTIIHTVKDDTALFELLHQGNASIPYLLFLDLHIPFKGGLLCLQEIRSHTKFKEISIAVYDTTSSERQIEEILIKGANVYMRKPNDFFVFKKILTEVITIHWQYHTSGLNKELFVLNIR
jgi:CheY-like chemotaxis protein